MNHKKFAIGLFMFLSAGSLSAQNSPEEKLNMAMYAIMTRYVDSVKKAEFVDKEIAHMLQQLDPYSEYLPPVTAAANEEVLTGIPMAVPIAPGSQPMPAGETQYVNTVSPPSTVKAAYMMDKHTGYIGLSMFAEQTPQDFRDALTRLKKQGMKNLVLDIHKNGGGLVDAAVEVASEFVPADNLVFTARGAHIPAEEFKTAKGGAFLKGRLCVLVSGETKSAAELLSGALQDWKRGVLIGTRTYGKGLIQETLPFSDGSALRISVARYFTPKGRDIQNLHGICPDVEVNDSATYANEWYQLILFSGVQRVAASEFVRQMKSQLQKNYKNYDDFVRRFDSSEVLKAVCHIAKDNGLNYTDEQLAQSEAFLKIQLKALVARDLYDDDNRFYQILHKTSSTIQRAHEIVSNAYLYHQYVNNAK